MSASKSTKSFSWDYFTVKLDNKWELHRACLIEDIYRILTAIIFIHWSISRYYVWNKHLLNEEYSLPCLVLWLTYAQQLALSDASLPYPGRESWIDQFSSVAQLCPTLCDPRDCSRLPCPSPSPRACSNSCPSSQWCQFNPLSSPSPPAFNFSSIRVFSNESVLRIRWPKFWSFNFSISPSNEYSGLISFRMNCLDLLAV